MGRPAPLMNSSDFISTSATELVDAKAIDSLINPSISQNQWLQMVIQYV